MANTPLWSFRIPADLRERAVAKAKERRESVTDVVIEAIREYVGETSPATAAGLSAVPDPFMPPPPSTKARPVRP